LMRWMMVTRPSLPSLVAENVGEICTQSIIKDFTGTNTKYQISENNKRTEAAASVFLTIMCYSWLLLILGFLLSNILRSSF